MIFESLEVGPLGVNCFILGCEETGQGVVIDAGGDARDIIAVVERQGLTIAHIINTHGHFDHIGANRALKERFSANLMIHAADIPLLDRAADIAKAYGIPGENSPQPDTCLEDGMEISFGKLAMTVLHTPGHSPGGCCFYLEAEQKIITGDTLFADSIGRTDLPGGSHEQLLDSVRAKLFTLPDHVVAYPGHGPETTIGHEKRHNPYF
ncbi:MBL fold metallo-hydrolase [Pelobacter propionicus]|uniref:Beta-lactamase domain protein n=1 Tax=Pelobacter propionicus (strain DSM 2379 / NBRC 103807 / OttBd1) TaxID=338966 RepID=A1AK59_PELPD|nr:MBL fold metallo-hydrolase [Pelobacter propionicus]ABK97729.1 beta-lactamase domain protein [Pelobacter propionicus DSM 2379]